MNKACSINLSLPHLQKYEQNIIHGICKPVGSSRQSSRHVIGIHASFTSPWNLRNTIAGLRFDQFIITGSCNL